MSTETKTITITITNIPEQHLASFWKDGIKDAKKSFGYNLERSDNITLDFDFLCDNYLDNAAELFAEIIGGAIAAHLITEAHNYLNKEESKP